MRFLYQRLMFMLCLALVHSYDTSKAQSISFNSETLSVASRMLGLTKLDTLSQGTSLIPFDGYMISVRRHDDRIEHIGRLIFDPEVRKTNPSPVYDYLEYAYLDHTNHISDNPFLYQNLKFLSGEWKSFSRLSNTVPFSITSDNGKRYRVEWTMPDCDPIIVTFPVGYERLSMMSRKELESRFIEDLDSFNPSSIGLPSSPADLSELQEEADSVLRLPGETFMIQQINQDMYYRWHGADSVVILFDSIQPAHSLANLFHRGAVIRARHGLVLNFRLYDNNQSRMSVTVDQLLAYAQYVGCRVYWGEEDVDDQTISGTLILANENYGYIHILAISCPREALFSGWCVMQAEVSLFVPTSNIQNIYYKPEAKKKIKWQ